MRSSPLASAAHLPAFLFQLSGGTTQPLMEDTRAELLRSIADFNAPDTLPAWFEAKRRALAALEPSAELEASFRSLDVGPGAPTTPFGRYADPVWRKLALATFLADWACYSAPIDQVAFERLLYVMHVFPAGFRTFWARGADGEWLPVGYTGWYPVAEATFELLASRASTLRDRAVPPLPSLDPGGSYLYLFNYSILGQLRGTACAKQLVRALASDVDAVAHRGLAAITVSADGIRVAERFGMQRSGTLFVRGAEEHVYTRRITGP